MVVKDRPGQVGILGSILGEMGVLIKNIQLTQLADEDLEIEVLIQTPPNVSVEDVVRELSSIQELRSIVRLN